MGLLYLKNEEKQLYSAYGLTVYGRQDTEVGNKISMVVMLS